MPERIDRAQGRMVCIGHRGAKGLEPENTLRSIRKALELGCRWVEIDVWQVEGELLVFHDRRLERCTNGRGPLLRTPLAELRRLDAGGGEQIPLLAEVLDQVRGKASINIEIKGPDVVSALVDAVRAELAAGTPPEAMLVSSFDHPQLEGFHQAETGVPIGALTYGFPQGLAAYAERLGAWSANVALEFVDRRLVEDAHARGLKVLVYTVNEPDDIEAMDRLGVDAIFSDYPDRVFTYLRSR
jgi:glycerophosphoryl diester phosphodiesterase